MTVTEMPPKSTRRLRLNIGPGRLLIFAYGVMTASAAARSGFQIATKFDNAPAAYILSAISAVIYLIATVCLARSSELSRRIAVVSCSIELLGVIAVGIWSLLDTGAFPYQDDRSTVWAYFGWEYAFLPLILPILGLWWLRRAARRDTSHIST
jgi:cytochrome bd-type quinol oxidase subunit 2